MVELNLLELLDREPLRIPLIELDHRTRVVVTGAGGSIGSALVKYLYNRVNFVGCIDTSENAIFRLQQSLGKHPYSVSYRIDEAGRAPHIWLPQWEPTLVIHAGAFKHVGLMEDRPNEAFDNNTVATLRIGSAVNLRPDCKFVFISTDKAARPTCNMGASKRLAEAWVLTHCPGASVCRFGNVAGSSGSLIEIVADRLSKDLPVTLTDSKMKRWFITPDEAVQLVLASTVQPGLYSLSMGQQIEVKRIIWRIARQLHAKCTIQYGRPGPGEKLTEEIVNPDEHMNQVINTDFIHIKTDLSSSRVDTALSKVISNCCSLVEAANYITP